NSSRRPRLPPWRLPAPRPAPNCHRRFDVESTSLWLRRGRGFDRPGLRPEYRRPGPAGRRSSGSVVLDYSFAMLIVPVFRVVLRDLARRTAYTVIPMWPPCLVTTANLI